MLSRRKALRLGAAAALGFVTPARAKLNRSSDFTFVMATDLHCRDERCGPWLERVVGKINSLQPRPLFVMLGGDLADDALPAQFGLVREVFQGWRGACLRIPGNHDCTESGDFSAYKQTFPGKNSFNYHTEVAGCQFLAFDSTHGRSVFRTNISAETLGWLDQTMPSLSRTKPLIVLTHFPLGRNWLRPLNAHAVLDRMKGYAFVAALGGHWHGLTDSDQAGAHLSTGRCCSWWRENHDGSPEKGFTLCHVSDGRVTHEFIPVSTEGFVS